MLTAISYYDYFCRSDCRIIFRCLLAQSFTVLSLPPCCPSLDVQVNQRRFIAARFVKPPLAVKDKFYPNLLMISISYEIMLAHFCQALHIHLYAVQTVASTFVVSPLSRCNCTAFACLLRVAISGVPH
jgi:hypothetical protein